MPKNSPKLVQIEEHDRVFVQIKKIVSRKIMLAHVNFSKNFKLHADENIK